jgi:hypothetical protein
VSAVLVARVRAAVTQAVATASKALREPPRCDEVARMSIPQTSSHPKRGRESPPPRRPSARVAQHEERIRDEARRAPQLAVRYECIEGTICQLPAMPRNAKRGWFSSPHTPNTDSRT